MRCWLGGWLYRECGAVKVIVVFICSLVLVLVLVPSPRSRPGCKNCCWNGLTHGATAAAGAAAATRLAHGSPPRFPSAVYVHAPRGARTARGAPPDTLANNVPGAEAHWRATLCAPALTRG